MFLSLCVYTHIYVYVHMCHVHTYMKRCSLFTRVLPKYINSHTKSSFHLYFHTLIFFPSFLFFFYVHFIIQIPSYFYFPLFSLHLPTIPISPSKNLWAAKKKTNLVPCSSSFLEPLEHTNNLDQKKIDFNPKKAKKNWSLLVHVSVMMASSSGTYKEGVNKQAHNSVSSSYNGSSVHGEWGVPTFQHQQTISMDWTPEEQALLEEGLSK